MPKVYKMAILFAFLAVILVCGTIVSVLVHDGAYFAGALFACSFLGFFGLIVVE